MKARLIRHRKIIDERGDIEEIVIWQVPKSDQYPEGIRYRLAYIGKKNKRPLVVYDNHHLKGHHKHIHGQQTPYRFSGIDQLLEDYQRDVKEVKEI